MQVETTIQATRQSVTRWRREGERVAVVPTMGNLHEGHLTLVRAARRLADRVVVSIFVNPLQFGPGEDFESYPRTVNDDTRRLINEGVDLLFMPEETEIYPNGHDSVAYIDVPVVSEGLCGANRPGHFRGVATVVTKLFNIVQPDTAIFGQKDYQQLLVIRKLVADLCLPVEVVGVPTVREASGLAMSSRNGYLSDDERQQAAGLYGALKGVSERLKAGETDIHGIEAAGLQELEHAGLSPEYLNVRRAEDLAIPMGTESRLVALAAARLGRTRLIDNLLIELD